MEKGHGSRALSSCLQEYASLRRVNRRRIVWVLCLALAGVSMFVGAARIVALARTIRTLAPMPYEDRRAAVAGPYYRGVVDLRSELHAPHSIDLVVRGPREIDTAIFANYYLYPRLRGFYGNLDLWRGKRRNPDEPLVWVDARKSPLPRRLPYLQARAENGDGAVDPLPSLRLGTTLRGQSAIVPLVCSIDGAPPDEYVTPVAIENLAPGSAGIVLSYHDRDGWFERRELRLEANERTLYNDVLVELFGRMGIGWMQIESDQPVRVSASLANRGRRTSSRLLVSDVASDGFVTSSALHFSGPAAKLFLINPRDGWATVEIDAAAVEGRLASRIQLAPYELRIIPDPGSNITHTPCRDCPWSVVYRADRGIFVYASREDAGGTTHFAWREAQQ